MNLQLPLHFLNRFCRNVYRQYAQVTRNQVFNRSCHRFSSTTPNHSRIFKDLLLKLGAAIVLHPPMCRLFSLTSLTSLTSFTSFTSLQRLFNFATSRTVSARYFPGGTSRTSGPSWTRLIFSTRNPTR